MHFPDKAWDECFVGFNEGPLPLLRASDEYFAVWLGLLAWFPQPIKGDDVLIGDWIETVIQNKLITTQATAFGLQVLGFPK